MGGLDHYIVTLTKANDNEEDTWKERDVNRIMKVASGLLCAASEQTKNREKNTTIEVLP